MILAYGHVDILRDAWRARTSVEMWRSAEAGIRHKGEEKQWRGKERGEKMADGRVGMEGVFSLKGWKQHTF